MYHFESSENYCPLNFIEKAEVEVCNNLNLNKDDKIQLSAITQLEKLRNQLLTKEIELTKYSSEIRRVEMECVNKCNRSPFDAYEVHDLFYKTINTLLRDG